MQPWVVNRPQLFRDCPNWDLQKFAGGGLGRDEIINSCRLSLQDLLHEDDERKERSNIVRLHNGNGETISSNANDIRMLLHQRKRDEQCSI